MDRAAVLNGLAATPTETLDWQHSIVDLLKLVGMDSSLTARKELATELGYTGKLVSGSALWLHKAVMQKLADNGGKCRRHCCTESQRLPTGRGAAGDG